MNPLTLTQLPDETDVMWQLRLSNLFYELKSENSLLKARLRIADLKLARAAEFELSADSTPMFLKRQAG